jgi:zinc protease
MKPVRFIQFIALLALTMLAATSASALDVRRQVLDNGLVLLVAERHNLPIVRVAIGLNAGSMQEPAEKAGLANLTSSLLTAGTATRTAHEIEEAIEFVGGDIGASGGSDYSTVRLSVLKKDVDLGFDLLADIIQNPTFPEDELTKKKERIKGGLKASEDDPTFVASREFKKALFGDHPYGRLVTGTAETIDSITREDIVRFHKKFYVPDNAVMAVVGDLTFDEVTGLIKRYFGDWKKSGGLRLSEETAVPAVGGRTIIIDRDLTQATIILGHGGVARDDPDYYALSVMNYILGGGGFASRLMQNIREEKGLVYDIYSFFSASRFGGGFRVSLQTRNESAREAIGEVLREIRRIRSGLVDERELSDARSFLIGSFPMRIETGARIASFLVAVEFYGLGVEYIDNYPRFIESVTRQDILRVAKKHLDPDNYILVVVGDQEKVGIGEE